MNFKKIAICLPSYNESANIEKVTNIVDKALKKYKNYDTVIVNADSASTDNTNLLFNACYTDCKKHSLISKEKGKGNNLLSFFKYCNDFAIDYALCLDSDLLSLSTTWIDKILNEMINNNYDYVVPIYKRSRYEGSTTNHFAVPLVYGTTGYFIRQPIAGDFGFNKNFIKAVVNKEINQSIKNYGIDIFMTLTACNNNLRIKQLELDKKIHSPSYNKMESMFLEVFDAALFYLKNNKLKYNNQKIENKTNILKTRKFNHKDFALSLKEKYYIENINVEDKWIEIMQKIIHNPKSINENDYEYIQKIFINRTVDFWLESQKISAEECEKIIINQCKRIGEQTNEY